MFQRSPGLSHQTVILYILLISLQNKTLLIESQKLNQKTEK